METFFSANSAKKYKCEFCNISCSKKNDWDRHINTLKHKRKSDLQNLEMHNSAKNYECKCGKIYHTNCGLWKHVRKTNCKINSTTIDENKVINSPNNVKVLTNLVLEVVKSNSELQKQTQEMQKQMIDVCKTRNNTINTINNSHSNNKTFNMQVFLNEKCKDAMNIMEFVDSFTMQLSDLEDVGKLGYVEGISNIIIKKLNEMDVYKRPVHCSDTKRETLFVKDNNIWEKEGSGRDTLRRAIKYISKKNSDLLPAWSEENPASQNIYSKRNDDYIKIVLQAMGGRGDIEINENKIIKKISKSVMIDKSDF